jgi:hypothetical protein
MMTRTKTRRSTLNLEALEERQVLSTASASMHAVMDNYGHSALFYIDRNTNTFTEVDADHGKRALASPGSVLKFTAGVDGAGKADAFALCSDGSLWEWSESKHWTEILKDAQIGDFAAVKYEVLYVAGLDGSLSVYDPLGVGDVPGWSQMDGAGSVQTFDAVTMSDGYDMLFAIRGDGTFQEYHYGSWHYLSGVDSVAPGFSAGVGSDGAGDVYGVWPQDGSFWKWDFTNHWTRLADAGVVSQFSATNNGQCWSIGTDGTLDKFNTANTMMVVDGSHYNEISAAASNDVFVNWDFNDTIWERKAEGKWVQITFPPVADMVDLTGVSFDMTSPTKPGSTYQLAILAQTNLADGTATFTGLWGGTAGTGTLAYDAAGNITITFSWDGAVKGDHVFQGTISNLAGPYHIDGTVFVNGAIGGPGNVSGDRVV